MVTKTDVETNGTAYVSSEIRELRSRVERYLADEGLAERCEVTVRHDGNWFVLGGRVDSFGTKARLFSLVPEDGGARRIVDRVHVGRPAKD